jgi:hypothetical protein
MCCCNDLVLVRRTDAQDPSRSSGFMENVWPSHGPILPPNATNDIHHYLLAGSGKSILWFIEPSLFLSTIAESELLVFLQFYDHR